MNNARLRTATVFAEKSDIGGLGKFIDSMKIFYDDEIDVRTSRVAFDYNEFSEGEISTLSKDIENLGFWGFCLSLDDPRDMNQISFAKSVIKLSKNGFVNFRVSESKECLDSNAISPSVNLIEEVSTENNGFDNFRVGFSFGLQQETPFFPYSSMQGRRGFAVGLEYIDLIKEVIFKHSRRSINAMKSEIKDRVCWFLDRVTEACKKIESETGFDFIGIDISLAPYPYPLEDQSVVDLIETIGNIGRSRGDVEYKFGMNGTMFAHTLLTSVLKEIVDSGNYKTTGFNGLMYSVLEDTLLSSRFSSGQVGLEDMLLLSTTCGCGIDMVPISDRNSKKTISSLFFDIFAISSVISKPLGVRILPIPNSRPGDLTRFKHLFFTNAILPQVSSGISYNDLPAQIDDSEVKL